MFGKLVLGLRRLEDNQFPIDNNANIPEINPLKIQPIT